jgi:subtilase family serine protease
MFKKRCAEPGEPNKLLLFAKLSSPPLSCGSRKKTIRIKNIFMKIPNKFSIYLNFLNNRKNFQLIEVKLSLQFQTLL